MAYTGGVAVSSIVQLWYVSESKLAYQYSKTPPDREPDLIWIPKSIVEHRTKRGDVHQVELPEWFVIKEGI